VSRCSAPGSAVRAVAVGVLAAGTVRRDGWAGSRGPDPGGAGRELGRAGRELGRELADEVGRWAAERARAGATGALAALRDLAPAWRDPARVHARRMRRARRAVALRSTVAGGLGVVAATAWPAAGLQGGEVAAGGGTALVGAAAVAAGLRLRELRRSAPPLAVGPHAPLRRVPRDSPARGLLDRLAERERALAGLLTHLGEAGREPAAVAASAAGALRELGGRLTDVDRARRGATPGGAPPLAAAVTALTARLDAGVTAYDALVVAAAEAVAAEATLRAGDSLLRARLTEATDSLAGYAAGLHDLAD